MATLTQNPEFCNPALNCTERKLKNHPEINLPIVFVDYKMGSSTGQRPALNASNLKPCSHQVGGHMKNDAEPESFIDDEGRFYKPYTDGPRAEREVQFYTAVFPGTPEGSPRPHAAYPAPDADAAPGAAAGTAASTAAAAAAAAAASVEPRLQDIEQLRPFIPEFFGTLEHQGKKLIALEDMCKQYKRPCVMDCKLGFTTVYDWADERYKTKFKVKDAETTQSSLGFRVCGLQVHRGVQAGAAGEVFKPERDWSRKLNTDNIGTAFQLFASGDHLKAKDLYCDPQYGVLRQLRAFGSWARQQRSFQFYQASVLIMYEGEATDMQQAQVRVAFVDFAHAFQTVGGAGDENLSAAVDSLVAVIEKAVGV